jgi:glycosyltransferase involved in cell wall biosynthesis
LINEPVGEWWVDKPMKILFVHNNFPAQYRHLVAALGRDPEMQMAAIGSQTARGTSEIKLLKYSMDIADVSATHPFARRFDLECRRAEEVLYSLSSLAASGFVPDLILGHPGWGETLPLKTLEFPISGLDGNVALHLKNAATLLALSDCDCGISPTKWQRSTYPTHFQDKIEVIHEGVDTNVAKPNEDAKFTLPTGQKLAGTDEIVTFVARNLEPLRGYHIFMRALPRILEKRPRAQVLIVGGDKSSYGASPPNGATWKSIFFREIAERIDSNRVHFLGRLPYQAYLNVLQISSAHVYLTYPFVLSWSLLEAMSAGCAIIASDTAPVREAIDGQNGLLVPFFDVAALSERVIEVLANRRRFGRMRNKARQFAIKNYDAERICIPRMLKLIHEQKGAVGAAEFRSVVAQ